MTVAIEPARLGDAEAIRSLDGLGPASGRLLERDLEAPDRCCLVARADGEVIGYVAAAYHLDVAEVLDVVVDPAWRRRGIATSLLTNLEDRLRARGVAALTLEVRESGLGAQALYRGLGFVVEGRRPGYYRDGEAALILWRRPGQEA